MLRREKLLEKQENRMATNLILSASATVVAEVATLPICTVKTNYQVLNTFHKKPEYTVSQIVRRIYAERGCRGFYNASLWAISSQVLSTSSKYVFYQLFVPLMPSKCLAGAACGLASSFLTHPFDFFKINKQRGENPLHLIRHHGTRVLYRGFSKSAPKSMLGATFWFPFYEMYREFFFARQEESAHASKYASLLAAATTSLTTTTIVHPIDFLKTRQVSGESVFLGWNPITYYRGYWLHLARVMPHFMITMYLIEHGSTLLSQ